MDNKGKLLITLKSGDQKWMTKSEYKHYLKRLESLKSLYDEYVKYGLIDDSLSVIDKVQSIVNMGSELMGIICNTADKITITGYNSVKSQVNSNIIKEDFIEIVKFVSSHIDDDHSVDDTKLTKKMLQEIDKSVFKINFKKIFYNQFIEFNDFAVPESPKNVIFPKIKYSNNKKFKEIVKSCAKARQYLDQKLWPQYKEYAALAEYVTAGDLSYEKYKKLVDYQHYTGIDDKRFQGQDKRWEKMAENFLTVYRLCKKYGYDYFNNIENEIYNNMKELN